MEFTGEQVILEDSPSKQNRSQKEHLARYRFALSFVRGKSVLDIACGTGYGTKMLKDAGAVHVQGVDIEPKVIEYAKARYHSPDVEFTIGDAQEFCAPKKYDTIVSFETIEHVEDPGLTLRNFYKSLRGGGALIISTPNRLITSPAAKLITDKPSNPYHIREFTMPELRRSLEESGFKVDETDLLGQCEPKRSKNPIIRRIYKLLYRGSKKYSPEVQPLGKLPSLRYIVIRAQKSD